MLCILFILFRVIPSNQIIESVRNKHTKENAPSDTCLHEDGKTYQPEGDGLFDAERYFFCESTYSSTRTMSFTRCTFKNIKMMKTTTSYLIYTYMADCSIQLTSFIEIQYSKNMIYFRRYGATTRKFTFLSNTILKCNSLNTDDARVVFTDDQNNNIQNNYIFFDPTIIKGQAFYISFIDHTTFINNTVINSNCDKGGAIYSKSKDGSNNFQIIDCTFINCRGDNGGTIHFLELDHDLLIKNTVFENCQNYYNNDQSDMISITATKFY